MTVQQLIDRLKELPADASIEFPLKSYTQKYPTVYINTDSWTDLRWRIAKSSNPHDSASVRFLISAPEGVVISNKNKSY